MRSCSDSEGTKATKQVLDDVGMAQASAADCQHIRRICHVLSHRAACLVAAGIHAFTGVLIQLSENGDRFGIMMGACWGGGKT